MTPGESERKKRAARALTPPFPQKAYGEKRKFSSLKMILGRIAHFFGSDFVLVQVEMTDIWVRAHRARLH